MTEECLTTATLTYLDRLLTWMLSSTVCSSLFNLVLVVLAFAMFSLSATWVTSRLSVVHELQARTPSRYIKLTYTDSNNQCRRHQIWHHR